MKIFFIIYLLVFSLMVQAKGPQSSDSDDNDLPFIGSGTLTQESNIRRNTTTHQQQIQPTTTQISSVPNKINPEKTDSCLLSLCCCFSWFTKKRI